MRNLGVQGVFNRGGLPVRLQTHVVAAIVAGLAFTGAAMAGGDCIGDLDGNQSVDGADLAIVLSGWGKPGETDLDGSGNTDGADLAIVLSWWGQCPRPPITSFIGSVVLDGGVPVGDALVTSDQGGSATTGQDGTYNLGLRLGVGSDSIVISASAEVGGSMYQGSLLVSNIDAGQVNRVDPIVMHPVSDCDWLPLGSGVTGFVLSMAIFDAPSLGLFVGGFFQSAGGVMANGVARWNGSAWEPLGAGVSLGGGPGAVAAIGVHGEEAGGAGLYVGGLFNSAGGVPVTGLARWDGGAWSRVGTLGPFPSGGVRALAKFNNQLYVGGSFTTSGSVVLNRIARIVGDEFFYALGSGMNDEVNALVEFNAALYAGGSFTTAGGSSANRIAKWTGSAWSPVGSGMNGVVKALIVFDDGTGPALYAGGDFTIAGGVPASRIARWDGAAWSALGSGMNNSVEALTVFDDGTGPALFAGGSFTTAGGVSASRIARWNGTEWGGLESGVDAGAVYALQGLIVDPSALSLLFVGGDFSSVNGVVANGVAGWSCSQ